MTKTPQILTKALTSRYRGLKQAKNRKSEGLFLLEGVRLCEEAFQSSLELEACIIRKNFNKLTIPDRVTIHEANQTQLEQISDSKNPQGIICIARTPKTSGLPDPTPKKMVLLLDRIADPGNMGTIFRSALWFGVTDILLGPGCVDPYSPKVVRSSMGAITSLKLHFLTDLKTSIAEWKHAGGEVAALHMVGQLIQNYNLSSGLMLIIGSEAHGVQADLLADVTTLSIEKQGSGESLNAAMATGIALYELSKR